MIYERVKATFSEANHLFCACHLSKCEEKKLHKLSWQVTCTSVERNCAKDNMLKDIYRNNTGSITEFSFA